jgi:DNA-binding transcriptional MerR regulator
MTNPLSDIRHYSPTMTISQVLKFCEKKGIGITRAMVQNYIRAGLLPPPVNVRFYTHKHLAAMVMIERLKTVFDIPAIREALSPFMDEDGLSIETYEQLFSKTENLMRKWIESCAEILSDEKDGGTLLKMACAAAIKEEIYE